MILLYIYFRIPAATLQYTQLDPQDTEFVPSKLKIRSLSCNTSLLPSADCLFYIKYVPLIYAFTLPVIQQLQMYSTVRIIVFTATSTLAILLPWQQRSLR